MIDDVLSLVVIKKRRGSRSFRLHVRDDGSVTLTVPRLVSLKMAKKFLLTKADWIIAARKRMQVLPQRLLNQGSDAEFQACKAQAKKRVLERVAYFQQHYGVEYRRLTIRNQKSRFGSCSASGTLSFNYRLLFLPLPLLDYVVVHELCHLQELNHSRRFWALVALTIPDYQVRKRELQTFSRSAETPTEAIP